MGDKRVQTGETDGGPTGPSFSSDFEAVFVHSPAGLALVDLDGHFTRVSPAWSAITGYADRELLGRHFADITHPDDLALDEELVHELLRGERESYRIEKRYRHATGDWIWVELRVALVRGSDGPDHFLAAITDISVRQLIDDARRSEQGELTHRATHDRLTGLPNRALLDEHLRIASARVSRSPVTTVVLVCEPTVDEECGASVEAVLVEVAARLRDMSRQGDVVARLDDRSFAIVADALRYPLMALRLAERLVAAVQRPFRIGDATYEVGVNVGVTRLRADDEPADAIGRAVETRLRVAVTGGGYAFAPGDLRAANR